MTKARTGNRRETTGPQIRTEDTGKVDSLGRRIRRKPVTAVSEMNCDVIGAMFGNLTYENGEDDNHDHEKALMDHEKSAEYDGDYAGLRDHAEETLRERQELADEIIESGDLEEAMELITETLTDDTYDQLRDAQKVHSKEWEKKNRKFQTLGRELNKSVAEGEEYKKAGEIYPVAQEALDEAEKSDTMKMLADDNLNLVSKLSHHLENENGFNTITPWNGDTLGPEGIEVGGEFEVGSREWLEFRQDGVGGSDIGSINDYSQYRFNNIREIWDSKVEPISDEQVSIQERGQEVFDDPMSRGNAFEPLIGHLYGVKNPDVQLLSNKATWVKPGSNVRINYDFLTCDDGTGVPNGCLEIKTASKEDGWGPDGGGIDDVPQGYAAQLLAQMRHAGFKKGAVSVLIDGNDHRSYEVEMTPELERKADENIANAQNFYDNAAKARAGLPHEKPAEVAWTSSSDFPKNIRAKTDVDANKKIYLRELADVQGQSMDDVIATYENNVDANGGDANAALKSMYQNVRPTDISTFTGMDIETTGISPTKSRIIEMGITGKNEVNELYSLPDHHQKIHGTGAENVHNISAEDIRNQPRFDDPEVQERILESLTSGAPVVAHNAKFEKSFLRAHLKGFAEAESAGEVRFVDTMNIAKYGMPHLDRHRLQNFVEDAGMEYKNAHRAYADTEMMMDALKVYESQRK